MRADLIERLRKRADHIGLWLTDPPQTPPDATLMREAADALASLSSPQEPVAWRNEEAGFVEFINEDVPHIVRDIDGPVAILLDMTTRNVIGYRVYDPSPVAPVAASRWVTVRVEDTGDGLIIHEDDAKQHGLDGDRQYHGYFLPDGRYRIVVGVPVAAPTIDTTISEETKRALAAIDDNIRAAAAQASTIFVGVPVAAKSEAEWRHRLKSNDVEWVVNDLAELGVKIGDQFFFLYKGTSLVYGELDPDPTIPFVHEESDSKVGYSEGDRMKWRHVFKREFGECAHPINYDDPTKIGTVSLNDCDEWQDLPAAAPTGKGEGT